MRGRFDNLVADVATIRRALKLQEDRVTLGGNVTLLDEDGVIWAADAGGSSRNVTLPARAATNDGQVRLIVNLSTAGENLVIKNSAAATLLTLPSGAVGLVIATGTAEAPGTSAWIAVPVGGEDLAIADDLTVSGDLTVTGIATLNSTLVVASQGSFTSNIVVAKQASFTSDAVVVSTLDAQAIFSAKTPTLGKATSDSVKFFGGAGSSQRAGSNQASTNIASSTDFGTTQLAIVQEIMNTLTAHSLWKGAA